MLRETGTEVSAKWFLSSKRVMVAIRHNPAVKNKERLNGPMSRTLKLQCGEGPNRFKICFDVLFF